MSFKQNVCSSHLVIAGHCIALLLLVSTCNFIRNENRLSGVLHLSGQEFAGSEACMECHQSIAESHMQTPHFLTSRPASSETVKGSFDSLKNDFVLNENLKIVMEKTASGLFQVGFADGVEIDKKPFDIAVGSGRQGQTYLYWQHYSLYQLPVSYYSPTDTWSNSPGYPPDQIIFDRNVPARCMECHSTYMKVGKRIRDRDTFDKNQMLLGVDCERCHGPAGKHVTFHRDHPEETIARHIINPAHLTRQQRIDNCALCHSGIRDNFMPAFSFTVGDNLEDFSYPTYKADSGATLDVHGNQYGLLTSSKCFRMSSKMDCSTCHNVHVRETKNLDIFSARCMTCHPKGSDHYCKQPEVPGLTLSSNCIDCHMPKLPSRQVFVQASDHFKATPFFVRTHLIGEYETQTHLFLEKIKAAVVPEKLDSDR